MAKLGRRARASTRSGRKARAARAAPPTAVPRPTFGHPRFGQIPLVPRIWTDPQGREHTFYDYDPDYAPPLPKGAVRGDVRRQVFCRIHDVPRYFYVDQDRRCVQCDRAFVFRAREQKHWYETLGFNFASVAIRCPACRRQRRSDRALHHAVEAAKRQLADSPDDPATLMALAQAIVSLHERLGRGNLDQAIAAARKARTKTAPARWIAETLYLEATAQALVGREAKARALYESFLEVAQGSAQRQLVARATRWLDDHGLGLS